MPSNINTTEPKAAAASHRVASRAVNRLGSPWRLLLAGVPAVWIVVVAAYYLGVAIVLPPLVLVGTASLLRGGRTLLDRLMLTSGLLFGAGCLTMLVYSVWPWGLHPIPVAGTALTTLVLIAALTGRRPQLPRPTLGDGLSLAMALGVTAVVAYPLVTKGFITRLGIAANGEDFSRHFTAFDGARQIGGYLFLNWDAALDHVFKGMITYPQASHVTFALLDGFVRSSATEFGTGPNALDHFFGFIVATYGFFALTLAWAAQWIAGPTLTLNRRVGLIGVIGVFCLGSEIFSLVVLGYPAEIAGLIPAVLLVAVMCRPPSRLGPTLVLVSLLVIAIGFTYYLFLPAVGLMVGVWLVRKRMWRAHPWGFWLNAVAFGIAGIPAVMGITVGQQTGALLVADAEPPLSILIALSCAVAVGLVHQRAVRSGRWRTFTWSLISVLVVAGGLFGLQLSLGGAPTTGGYYYANKVLHLGIVVMALGLASTLFFLAPAPRETVRQPSRLTLGAIPGALLVLCIASAIGLVHTDNPAGGSILARAWVHGTTDPRTADAVLTELSRPVPPGAITVMAGADVIQTYKTQLLLAALQRTSGILGPGMYGNFVGDPNRDEAIVSGLRGPVVLVVDSDKALRVALQIQARYPDRVVEVVRQDG